MATLERLGVSIEPATRGLSFRRAEDLKGRRWVPWEEVATFVNRLPPEVDEQARAFAAEFNRANPLIQVLGRLTMDLRVFWELYATGSKAIAPYLSVEVIDDGELVSFRAQLEPGLTPCPRWFEWSTLLIESVPETVGLSSLDVRKSEWTGESLSLVVALPPSRAGAVPRNELADTLELFQSILRGGGARLDGSANTSEVLALQREFSLTRAEAKVAVQIGQGRSPKECAASLGSSYETVRTHLRRVYAKLGVSSQRGLAAHLEKWHRRRSPRPSPRRK